MSLVMCCFYFREGWTLILVHSNGRSSLVSPRSLDVRFVGHSANAGKKTNDLITSWSYVKQLLHGRTYLHKILCLII